MKNYKSIADALDDLRKRGYEADFTTQAVCLYCGDLDIRMDPDDFHIDEFYHFEDDSITGSNAILYAVSSSFGVKGTLMNIDSSCAASMSFEMTTKLQSHHIVT